MRNGLLTLFSVPLLAIASPAWAETDAKMGFFVTSAGMG